MPFLQCATSIYVPMTAMVVVSFISFIVETVSGRMAVLVTFFLMLVNIGNSERLRLSIVRKLNFF
jgi:uncharacterized membrane protein